MMNLEERMKMYKESVQVKSKEEKNTELLNFKLLMYDVGLTKKHFFN